MSESTGGLLAYLVRHRTAANLLLALMLLGGIAGGTQIRSQFLPDIIIERVTVRVTWSGAGPQDVDENIVALLEPALLTIEGVESTYSTAIENLATVTLEFEADWDMGQAMDDVKAVVDGITNLPETAKDPVIRRGAFRDRVADVVIHGPMDVAQLALYADTLQAKLFRAGVARTSVIGVPDPVIQVAVPEAQLLQHDLSLSEVADAISAESEADPAGDIGDGRARVSTGVDRRSLRSIGSITLRSRDDGTKLYVRDVANVRIESAEDGVAYFHRDEAAVVVRVDRSGAGDAIEMQRTVERTVAQLQPELPQGVAIKLTRTRAEAISDRLDILLRNGAFGLALVVLFLFLFLSARTAFWVAAGIPAALAATIGLMYLAGLTLNMVSLFALIICLGVVVDDAIVVGEHADFLSRKGFSPVEAATRAAKRMAAPVFSAAITTIIAFSALILIGGRFGSLILDIPFTVAVVLIASLAESFLILPAHMRHALSAKSKRYWYDAPSRVVDRGFRWFVERVARPGLNVLIRVRYPVLALTVMLLLISVSAVLDRTVRWRFFNAPERGTISANIAMLPGAQRGDTRAMLEEMQRALDAVSQQFEERHGVAPVEFTLSKVGGTTGRGLRSASTKDKDALGGFAITLIDPDVRPYSAFEFIRAWRDEIREHPLLETLALRGQRSGPGGDAVDVKLFGADAVTLKAAAEALKTKLEALPAVSALEDTLAYDKIELRVTLLPEGEALGFNTQAVGTELYRRMEGINAAEFPLGARTATVRVSLPENELDAAFLHHTQLRAPGGSFVPLMEVAKVEARTGFASVRRENGLRTLRVTGDVSEDDPAAAAAVTEALEATLLPELAASFPVEWEISGLAEQERDFLSDAAIGGLTCMAGIYSVLAWVFASWTRPLVVMVVIPFGLIGTIWGHHWHGVPLSMFSVVGLIGMSGIIINDSIILVTTIDEYARDRALLPALKEAVLDRLRPVLLTTLTTVFGLAPLLFETSRQAQFLLPTVITLVYGLGFGVVLVLLVTPSIVAVHRDIGMSLRALARMARYLTGRRRYGRIRVG
jgi:multidrug efflux pump subunit AcrB